MMASRQHLFCPSTLPFCSLLLVEILNLHEQFLRVVTFLLRLLQTALLFRYLLE